MPGSRAAGQPVAAIMAGEMRAFFGIDVLRKICNHPDLATAVADAPDYRDPATPRPHLRSGKMTVMAQLLRLWHSAWRLFFCLARWRGRAPTIPRG